MNIRLICLDCNERSGVISRNDEIMKVNATYLREILKKEKVVLLPYFLEIARFIQAHSGHKIALVNQHNEILSKGEFK